MVEIQAATGLTYLFISHHLRVVRESSSHVTVMSKGVVVEPGLTDELLRTPKEDYTRALRAADGCGPLTMVGRKPRALVSRLGSESQPDKVDETAGQLLVKQVG